MNQIHKQSSFSLTVPEQSTTPVHGTWAVPWSDLMMVMFILFLVLFIFHARQQETIVPRALFAPWEGSLSKDSSNLNLDPLYDRARSSLGADSSSLKLERDAGGDLVVSLFGETFFSPGSTELNPESSYFLEKISEIVSLAQGGIVVSGFADPGESRGGVWEISSLRAARIGQALIDSGRIRMENIVIHGYGTTQPRVPAGSPASGERNRRVEIRILT